MNDLAYKIVNIILVSLCLGLQVSLDSNSDLKIFYQSYVFQIAAAVLLMLDHRTRINSKKEITNETLKVATRYTHAIQIVVFVILIIQVFLLAFAAEPIPAEFYKNPRYEKP